MLRRKLRIEVNDVNRNSFRLDDNLEFPPFSFSDQSTKWHIPPLKRGLLWRKMLYFLIWTKFSSAFRESYFLWVFLIMAAKGELFWVSHFRVFSVVSIDGIVEGGNWSTNWTSQNTYPIKDCQSRILSVWPEVLHVKTITFGGDTSSS